MESFNHLPIYYFVKKNLSSVNEPLVKVLLLVNIKERNPKPGRGFGSKSSCNSQASRNQYRKDLLSHPVNAPVNIKSFPTAQFLVLCQV